jgi:hypothetical protein
MNIRIVRRGETEFRSTALVIFLVGSMARNSAQQLQPWNFFSGVRSYFSRRYHRVWHDN